MNLEHVLTWLSANWLSLCALLLSLIAVVGQVYNYSYTVNYTKRVKKQEKITELMREVMAVQISVADVTEYSRRLSNLNPDKDYQEAISRAFKKVVDSLRKFDSLMESGLDHLDQIELEKLKPHIEKSKTLIQKNFEKLKYNEQASSPPARRKEQPDTRT